MACGEWTLWALAYSSARGREGQDTGETAVELLDSYCIFDWRTRTQLQPMSLRSWAKLQILVPRHLRSRGSPSLTALLYDRHRASFTYMLGYICTGQLL